VFYLLRLFTIKVTENQIIAEMLLIICCRGIEFGEKKGDNGDFCCVFWWGGAKKFGLIYFDFQWIEKFFKEKCKNNLVCWEKSSIFATSNQENESCLTS
jgi:hypothetical protein